MPKSRPTLETERLVLRPFEMGDAPRVQLLAGDRSVAATTKTIPHPYEDGMAEQWIGTHQDRFENGQEIVFAITRKDGGELIGAIGLTLNLTQENAEMGYWIGKPYWGRGYCTEAGRAVLLEFRVARGATVAQVLERAAGCPEFAGIDVRHSVVGVFGRLAQPNQPVEEGDRLEILRPLAVDPKAARRARAREARKRP